MFISAPFQDVDKIKDIIQEINACHQDLMEQQQQQGGFSLVTSSQGLQPIRKAIASSSSEEEGLKDSGFAEVREVAKNDAKDARRQRVEMLLAKNEDERTRELRESRRPKGAQVMVQQSLSSSSTTRKVTTARSTRLVQN